VYKETKQKTYERERRKPLVALWLANVTNHNVYKVLSVCLGSISFL